MRRIDQPVFAVAIALVVLLMTSWGTPAQADEHTSAYVLQVDGLACPFCAYGIEKQLGEIDGVKLVETEIKSGTVIVTMQDGISLNQVAAKNAVEAAGFTLRAFKSKGAE